MVNDCACDVPAVRSASRTCRSRARVPSVRIFALRPWHADPELQRCKGSSGANCFLVAVCRCLSNGFDDDERVMHCSRQVDPALCCTAASRPTTRTSSRREAVHLVPCAECLQDWRHDKSVRDLINPFESVPSP